MSIILEKVNMVVSGFEPEPGTMIMFKADMAVVGFTPTPPEVYLFKADMAVVGYDAPITDGRRRQANFVN